jgi:hypothetical protein
MHGIIAPRGAGRIDFGRNVCFQALGREKAWIEP